MNPLTIPSGCNNFTHLDGIFSNGTLTLFLAEDRWLVAFMRALEVCWPRRWRIGGTVECQPPWTVFIRTIHFGILHLGECGETLEAACCGEDSEDSSGDDEDELSDDFVPPDRRKIE